MGILIRTCLYKSEPKQCTMSRNHSLSIRCLSFSPPDPFSTLFHSAVRTGLSGSRVMSSSFHLHLANAETQKDEKEEEREVIFPLLPSAGFPQAGRVPLPDHTHAKLALPPTLSFLVLGTLSSCCFKLRHASSHYKPRSTACHLVVFLYLPTPMYIPPYIQLILNRPYLSAS